MSYYLQLMSSFVSQRLWSSLNATYGQQRDDKTLASGTYFMEAVFVSHVAVVVF